MVSVLSSSSICVFGALIITFEGNFSFTGTGNDVFEGALCPKASCIGATPFGPANCLRYWSKSLFALFIFSSL